MKERIVNRKITALIFSVMFLVCGIVGFGYAHSDNTPHFHGSQIRYLLENAEGGTLINGLVVCHN